MFSAICYQRADGTKGETLYRSEQEARLSLEQLFVQHHAWGRSVSVETKEDGTTLYFVRDVDGQLVEKHRLYFVCSEVA